MTPADQLAKNAAANKALAIKEFPNETWINSEKINLYHVEMPKNADEIIVAMSRLPINLQEEIDFIKELKSAVILKKYGASITLIPRIKRSDEKGFKPGPDAIVNGLFFEFKTVTGRLDKIGARFRESRIQGNNVYIRIDNPLHTKRGVLNYLSRFINNPKYKGGYIGDLILTVETSYGEKTCFLKISDLKNKKIQGSRH